MTLWFDIFIVALLPLAALFTVIQTQPYFALVSRGILGAVAVMLYAVLGAPDVALTEALVGTLLTVILYAITVRSTLVFRLGRLRGDAELPPEHPIRCFSARYGLALKDKIFINEQALVAALRQGLIDAVHIPSGSLSSFIQDEVEQVCSHQFVTVFAEHGRWHERKMTEMMQDQSRVKRLSPAKTEDDH